MNNRIDKDTPLLVKRIREALESTPFDTGGLRVSVADNPKWERSAAGDEVLVRWLCWSIYDGDKEITPPEFEVVSKQVTRERLERELPSFFENIVISIDNDIDD